MEAAVTTAPPASMRIATTRRISNTAARRVTVRTATIHPRRSAATAPEATSVSGVAPPLTAPAVTTARRESMRSENHLAMLQF